MNSLHDMGGTMNYGPVAPEANEPVFHADWERKALALTVLMGACGQWNIDQARAARESLPPLRYLSNTYYQIWLDALGRMMTERGLVSAAELDAGRAARPGAAGVRKLPADAVVPALMRGSPSHREAVCAGALRRGRRGAHCPDASRHAHAAAALCARQARHHQPLPRRTRVPRLECARPRRGSAVAVHGALRGA